MDSKLNWDPDEYGGVEQLIVPSELLWLPDILLYNKYEIERRKFESKIVLFWKWMRNNFEFE